MSHKPFAHKILSDTYCGKRKGGVLERCATNGRCRHPLEKEYSKLQPLYTNDKK